MGPFLFHRGEGTFVELVEAGRTIGLPQEPTGVGGSAVVPKVLGGSEPLYLGEGGGLKMVSLR